MSDIEKVIKTYECCKNPWNRRCEECPIEKDCCHDGLPTFAIKDALELLKEQEAVIEQLKRPDCEHANHDGAGCLGYCGCEQDDEPIDACKQCEKYTGNICSEY